MFSFASVETRDKPPRMQVVVWKRESRGKADSKIAMCANHCMRVRDVRAEGAAPTSLQ